MSFSRCINTLPSGSLCTNRALKTGFCRHCDPASNRQTSAELLEKHKKELLKKAEKEDKRQQRQEIFEQQLGQMIGEVKSLEDLRMLNLKVMQALADGTIEDPRTGSPIAQLMKQQQELILKVQAGSENLKPDERTKAIELAREMTPEQMLGLIGDLAHGMKTLIKEAKKEAVVVTVVDAENVDRKLIGGPTERPASKA